MSGTALADALAPAETLTLTSPPVQAPPAAQLAAVPSLPPLSPASAPPPPPSNQPLEVRERRLEIPPYDLRAARRLQAELGVSSVLAQVLVRRGYAETALAREFLDARVRHEPSRFEGIDEAVATIRRHLRAGSRITIHGDYDVDGVCATAILVRALRRLGGQVDWFLPSRIDDGYGLSLAAVQRLAARGTALLITVDCAITAVEEVAAARGAGIDVVVSDHHAPRADGALPDAPVVHPAVCGYPCPHLCGTGVAFKLAEALEAPDLEEELDLVALATVADLVPLADENRTLVRDGLRTMAGTSRPGLRALMAISRTDPSDLNAGHLGFRLAPRINAAGRLYRADAGVELLLCSDQERAREIAAELDAANHERRMIEQQIGWAAEAQVAEQGERPAYVLAGEDWHPGVIGIVASRIAERYHRPALLIALGAGGEATGSGRSIPGFDLLAGLRAVAEELSRFGGHRAAAGLTIETARVPALRERFEAHAASVLTPELLTPVERVDAVVAVGELGLDLAEELGRLEPCGMANPTPRLLVPGATFEDLRPMGENGAHLRFAVQGTGVKARGVSFGCGGQLAVAPGERADATFRLQRNVWNGMVEPQLVLRHAQLQTQAAIEILGEPGCYVEAALEELERTLPGPDSSGDEAPPLDGQGDPLSREVLDRRGDSPLAVIADVLSCGESVLVLCADVTRRISGLAARAGTAGQSEGFCLAAHHALERDPHLAGGFAHLVVLDPPSSDSVQQMLRAGSGFTHLCWGEAELRFAQQMHELEYQLRRPLIALYRSLRQTQRAMGAELEHLLRGDRPPGRPARLAGRLIRVLTELELVALDPDLPAMAIAGSARTELERSPAYRAYAARHEDGRRFLSSVDHRPSG